jgi:uncharacterized membrane protein YkoI
MEYTGTLSQRVQDSAYRTMANATSRRIMLAAALTAAVAAACFGLARADDDDHVEAARLRRAGEILSLEKILERARAEHPGKVLEAELERERGSYVYEVEILDDKGVVWEMKFDARSGSLLESERDD